MKKNLILIGILLIASFLRLYQLGQVPVSPDWDEAALGYNAYSILKTGRDEYGTFFPLSIRSFDDYKPPLYTYLTVPSVGLLGLSAWSTRLPSALMGILAVLGTYFLVKELFKSKNPALPAGRHELTTKNLPIIASALLAISPWHIQFSRIAFEANIGITVNIFAVTLFLMGLRKKIYFPFSAALFGLGMYAYHSERIFLPLLLCLLLAVYRKQIFIKEHTKILVTSAIVGLIVVVPLIPVLFNKSAMLRLRGTSSFTDQTNLLSRNINKLELDTARGDWVGMLLDNRRIVWAKTVISGYLSHFSFNWLFLTGDNPRHHAPDMGLLYLWELPFLLYGLFYLLATSNQQPATKLLLGWLLIAPIAAAPTTGLPHAIRTLVFLPTFQIITSIGVISVFAGVKRKVAYAVLGLLLMCIIGNGLYYLDMYFVQQNPENSEYWQYGYKEAVTLTEKIKSNYEKVVVSTNLEQSYMFFLFYTRYDPTKYLASGGTKSGSFAEVENKFDAYEFRTINWSKEKRDGTILYVGAPFDMPHGNVGNIKFLNGKPAIEIADQANGAP